MKTLRAIVIGGSVGGLFAANLLRSIGWDVEVFERVGDDLASRGAGIGTHEELFALMRRLGISVDDSIGVHIASKICLDKTGHVVHEVPMKRIMSSWGRVYRSLKDIFPDERYHFGMSLERVEQDAAGVTACFADGARAHGDLLVAADGIWSTVRSQLMPEVRPQYAGYVAWRGTVEESAMPPALHAEIFALEAFCLPEGEQMITYPVPGRDHDVRPGHRRYNFVWYHPVDERRLRELCTDASGHCHGFAIAPPLIRPQVITDIRAFAHEMLSPQVAAVVDLAVQPFFQAIFDIESPRIVHERIALLGDAAFVARPHVGMGVTKAALDAEGLPDEIVGAEGDLHTALAQYEVKRRLFGTRAVARSRRLGAHLEAQLKPREMRSEEELHQRPEVVMREAGAQLSTIPELAELVHRRPHG